jgi:hypothetical protein
MQTRPLILALALALAGQASSALGQSAVPIGYWTTADNSERLLIEVSTNCSFFAVGGTQVAGNCVWQSTSRGGILTLYYQTVMGLAPIYWSVVWVNDTTITVEGDVFYRRQ